MSSNVSDVSDLKMKIVEKAFKKLVGIINSKMEEDEKSPFCNVFLMRRVQTDEEDEDDNTKFYIWICTGERLPFTYLSCTPHKHPKDAENFQFKLALLNRGKPVNVFGYGCNGDDFVRYFDNLDSLCKELERLVGECKLYTAQSNKC